MATQPSMNQERDSDGLASEAEVNAYMATTAATFRQEEAARRRMITSSPFFEDAPVAVRVRPLSRYQELFGEDDS